MPVTTDNIFKAKYARIIDPDAIRECRQITGSKCREGKIIDTVNNAQGFIAWVKLDLYNGSPEIELREIWFDIRHLQFYL